MKVFGVIWLAAISYLAFCVSQNEFIPILVCFGSAFLASYYLISHSEYSFRDLIVLGLIVRAVLFFASPSLSDDIYRFIWDGRTILEGYNPYGSTPNMIKSSLDTKGLYDNLNSKDYYSVYPAICQLIFVIATWISGSSVFWSGFIIKIFLLIADLSLFRLLIRWLKKHEQDPKRALWYLLNPLVIIETFANLHFEVIMIAMMLYALMFIHKNTISAIALAGGIATKLLPALAIPIIVLHFNWRKSLKYITVLGVSGILLFLPILFTLQHQGFSQSLNLYFQTFEFNASLYYLVREIGFMKWGYNAIHIIGPFLASSAGLGIMILSYYYRSEFNHKWPEVLLLIFTLYFSLATTVHPWYILTPLVLSLLTKYNYAILWSALVPLSYHAYTEEPVAENMYLVGFQYTVLFAYFLFEIRKNWRTPSKTI